MIWARLMASARSRPIVGTLGVMLAVIALVGAVVLLSRCGSDEKAKDAVRLDAAEVSATSFRKGMEAERAATANEMAASEAFANQQQELTDAAREADSGDNVGNSTRSVLERMRSQQASGRGSNASR